jgi:hypothetical protein
LKVSAPELVLLDKVNVTPAATSESSAVIVTAVLVLPTLMVSTFVTPSK